MPSANAVLVEKEIFADVGAGEPGDSDVILLNGASKLCMQAVYDVSAPTAKTFDSPLKASLVDQSLTYTAVDAGADGNDISIEITAPASGTHPLDVTVAASAITISLETTAAVAATGTLNLTADIILTSVATGVARDTETLETLVNAAAANPAATVLVTFAGTAAAITCTITPNDGTNNGAVPVDLTTAELVELINTGAVVGKTITLTDASSFRILQTATGGDATPLANGGEGDGVTATFSGGADFDDAISSGNAVKAAVNADPEASLLVLVSGSNASALTTLAEDNLAGGSDGEVNVADSEITIPSHGYPMGLKGQLTTTGTLPGPLQLATDYFIIVVDANTVQFASSLANAQAGTFIELVDDGADNSVNTFTATALSGASVTFQASNDGTNWTNLQSATSITVDGSVLYEKDGVAFKYFKAVKALAAGMVDLQGTLRVIGDAI